MPNAHHFDIDSVSDKSTQLPHMLPSAQEFAHAMSAMGICNNDHVCVYVQKGCFSAARVWWTFKVFNHENVSILDGGLEAWKEAGGELCTGSVPDVTASAYAASGMNKKLVVDWTEVMQVVDTGVFFRPSYL